MPQTFIHRQHVVLRTLVEHYIRDGVPVASKALANDSQLDLSSASIRHLLAGLEEQGLVISPHTSSGRIPTDQGYRLFVDHLVTRKPVEAMPLPKVSASDGVAQLAHHTSVWLSELSGMAAIVAVPRSRRMRLKHVEFLALSSRVVVVIMVNTQGEVHNRLVQLAEDYSEQELTVAARFVNEHFSGLTLKAIGQAIKTELGAIHQDIRKVLLTLNPQSVDSPAVVATSGESRLLASDLNKNLAQLQHLFSLLEEKNRLLSLLDKSHSAKGVKVYIGSEWDQAISSMSWVSAATEDQEGAVGVLGVIGPTRMDYSRLMPMVEAAGQWFSEALKAE